MTTDSHVCTPDRPYPHGIMACVCGQFWMRPGRDILRFAFVNPGLLGRLRSYQSAVRWGDAPDIATAVAAAALRERKEREAARIRLATDWPRLQAAKRAKWHRAVRAIILAGPCAYCGGTATDVDHITPRSRGGSEKMRNLAPACSRCNSEKGNRTPAEWQAWCLRRGRAWPPAAAAA